MRATLAGIRRFCSSSGSSSRKGSGGGKAIDRFTSGGKYSYIGLGKFEGVGREVGSIQKGLEYLREALRAHTSTTMTPEQTREAGRFHHDIAMCHHREGNIPKAVEEYRNAVSTLEDLLLTSPSSDASTLPIIRRIRFDLSSAYSGLSVALADANEDESALNFAQKALEIRKSLMGPNHGSVAECLNNLGGLYFRQGMFNRAAEVYQESLRILLTKTQGKEENKYVALAYYNIGLTYDKLDLKKGADAVYKALLIAEHVWGSGHDQTEQIRASWEELSKRNNR
jgi:tetratricopeptide (TPR) repeat protein